MAATKLTCPECSTVLRPAKPVAPGKKVKCPRCDSIFTAGAEDEPEPDEDEEEERPARSARKAPAKAKAGKQAKPAAKAAPKEAPKKPASDDDDGAYSVAREEEKEEEDKPKINYAPDTSIKDLRGPAVAVLMVPSNKLALAGMVGVIGWVVFLIILLIPAAFPILEDDQFHDVMQIGPGLSQVSPWATTGSSGMMMGGGAPAKGVPDPPPAETAGNTKIEEEKPGFFEVGGVDLAALTELPWYKFMAILLPFIVLGCYSGVVAFGAIKMQNLESRGWGIAACIMAMLPLNAGGIILVTALVVNIVLSQIMDDQGFIQTVTIGVVVLEWLGSLAAGIYAMFALFNEDVVAGFEYVGE